MFEKVKNLRNQFRNATEEEKDQIQKETDALREENPEAWADAMLQCMKESNATAKRLVVFKKKRMLHTCKIIFRIMKLL